MLKRIASVFIIMVFIPSILSGCWDKVEIDQRGFVEVIMVDPAPPGYEQKMEEETKDIPGIELQKSDMIKVTYVFPNTGLFAGQGGGDQPGFVSLSSVATSISKANTFVDSRVSRRLYFGHTQIAVFGEKLFENPEKIKEVIDHFRRDPQFSRTIKVLITPGEASKISEIKPKVEKLLFRYIRGILDNEATNGSIIDINLSEFLTMLNRPEKTSILPNITAEGDELKISGAAVIKDLKVVGHITEYDTLYFNTLRGVREGGREIVNVGDLSVEFATTNTTRKLELINDDPDNLEIKIGVRIEGTLVGGEFDKELFDSDTISKIEEQLNKMSEESCSFVLKKLQKDFKADALLMSDYLEKFHPSVWEKVKDKWSEIYPEIKIVPEIDNKVRRIGTVK